MVLFPLRPDPGSSIPDYLLFNWIFLCQVFGVSLSYNQLLVRHCLQFGLAAPSQVHPSFFMSSSLDNIQIYASGGNMVEKERRLYIYSDLMAVLLLVRPTGPTLVEDQLLYIKIIQKCHYGTSPASLWC